jgi:signal transduction histidine kinase
LLEDVAETLSPLAEAKGLALECHVAPNLTLHSDRDSLIRLFVNLVDNAIKFTQSGKVTVAALIESGLIRIDVIDTGKGIMSEHLGHVFDRFYRVDAARTQIGAGLGLAIALQIARACGGDITVTSNWGGGTTFSVTLPVV